MKIRGEAKLLRVLFGYFNNELDEEAVKAQDFEQFVEVYPPGVRHLAPILELGEEAKNSILSGQKRALDFSKKVDMIPSELECKAKNEESSYWRELSLF